MLCKRAVTIINLDRHSFIVFESLIQGVSPTNIVDVNSEVPQHFGATNLPLSIVLSLNSSY